jgi:hypothetical protein
MARHARFVPVAHCFAYFGLLLTGCSDSASRQPVYVVKGRVLVRGVPVAHAKIFLLPLSGDDRDTLRPRATTAEDGTFTLTTYEQADGASAGEYAVGITWRGPRQAQSALSEPDPSAKDFGKDDTRLDYFKNRYRDPKTSGIKIKVDAAPTSLPDIDLSDRPLTQTTQRSRG